uniref:Uncharacterized protein n=1 Tax=Arundo donax TaxID=35708 RepID=A0A0A9J1N8_ARUDO
MLVLDFQALLRVQEQLPLKQSLTMSSGLYPSSSFQHHLFRQYLHSFQQRLMP